MRIFARILGWTGLAVIVVAGGLFLFVRTSMSVLPTSRVAEGLFAVNDRFVNMFVIRDARSAVCIDAGMSASNVAAGFRKLGIDPDSVKAVFFTHSDRDHVGGASLFRKAVFYMPEAEVPLANGSAARVLFGRTRTNLVRLAYMSLKPGVPLRVGETMVQPIWTPGHTPGSTSYLVEGKWLFTGDLLMLKAHRATVTWKAMNMDTPRSFDSARMLALDFRGVEILLTGHSGITRNFDKAMEKFR